MNRFNRTVTGWVLCAGLLLAGSVFAGPEAVKGSASATIKQTSERMLAALERQRPALERNPSRIYGLVDQILVPHFDFERITRAAVGKQHWGKATPTQRRALIQGFQELLIRTYAKALLNYSGQKIRYLSEAPGRHSSVRVFTEVREPGADPVPVNYKVHKKGGVWKVFDVKIDSVSLVSNYRGSFNAEIRRNGIEGLISRIKEMNTKGKQ
ncbi:MlaC/ttg2D family ABC transporter substrate-binding protein [Candidatus Thiosymbion oneisti]|uniref:MlaC/ttg2D family ABC transporter substrate-binding protein n=1 Tax=Candidatus Thiosymbion oneisti TaxID=589554 RepID=UPI000B7F03AE|nr:ABC transporter substrate-binding protein [Candidatus Thiosymbion oneisti]